MDASTNRNVANPSENPDPKNRVLTEITTKLNELKEQVDENEKAEIDAAITALETSLRAPAVNEATLNSVKLSLERTITAYSQSKNEAVLKKALEGMQKLAAEGATGIQDPKMQEFLKKIPGGDRLGPMLEKVEGYIQAYPSFLNAGKFKEWAKSDSPLWKLIMSYLKTLPQSEINYLQTELAQYGKSLANGTDPAAVRQALNAQVSEGKIKEKEKNPTQDPTYDFVDHVQRTLIKLPKDKTAYEIKDFQEAGAAAIEDYHPTVIPPENQPVTPETAGAAQNARIAVGENKNLLNGAVTINAGLLQQDNKKQIKVEKEGTKKIFSASGLAIESLLAVPTAGQPETFGALEIRFTNNSHAPVVISAGELEKMFTQENKNKLTYGTNESLEIEIEPDQAS